MPAALPPLGLTTTVPVEIVHAAGRAALDLNNVFIASPAAQRLVGSAEERGFPQSACAWIKGIYGVVRERGVREIVGVVEGDCSDTRALLDILRGEGVLVYPFSYPYTHAREDLLREFARFADALGATLAAAEEEKARLDEIRREALDLDNLAAGAGSVPSAALFDSLLLLTDFAGGAAACRDKLRTARQKYAGGEAWPGLRLGFMGVPPILSGLWDAFEQREARFIWQEVPGQFARLDGIGLDLVDSYAIYTYPYEAELRLADLARAEKERRLDGVVHYVQSFCHRQMFDRVLREAATVPVLTIEADRPGPVDSRTLTRIEAFLEQLGG